MHAEIVTMVHPQTCDRSNHSAVMPTVDPYLPIGDNVFCLPGGVQHNDAAFDPSMFPVLHRMQSSHFWYLGRHRFLWHAVQRWVAECGECLTTSRCIDIGGACGGWVRFMLDRTTPAEMAVGDSCRMALDLAADVLPTQVTRYQLDICDLQWLARWDVVFALDVLEHIEDDHRALTELYSALRPGGLAFVTVPALRAFWSWYDELDGHKRRYSRTGIKDLGRAVGFDVLDTRYFNCLLSPVAVTARLFGRARSANLAADERARLYRECHRVPRRLINAILTGIFAAESPIGHIIPLPWGLSCLAVFRKPVRT